MAKITIDPNPPTQGEECTVCYEYDGGTGSRTVTITWIPSSIVDPSKLEFTPDDNCKTIVIPDGATGWTLEDESGEAPDAGGTITPATHP